MTRRALFVVLAAIAALATACGDAPPPPSVERTPQQSALSLLREIAAKYKSLRSYEADVDVLVEHFVEGDETKWRVRGRLTAARPLKFRWESTEPWRVTAVSDGETLWTHLPDLNLVRAQPAAAAVPRFPRNPSGTDPFPALILLPLVVRDDPQEVLTLGSRRYKVVEARADAEPTVEVSWLDEEMYGTAMPEAVTRYTRGADGLVRSVEHEVWISTPGARRTGDSEAAVESRNARVRIRTRETHDVGRTDVAVADTAFLFTPPPGAQIVQEFPVEEIRSLRRRMAAPGTDAAAAAAAATDSPAP